jgi:Aldose 1-epimerase
VDTTGPLRKILLNNSAGCEAEIYTLGACVTSFKASCIPDAWYTSVCRQRHTAYSLSRSRAFVPSTAHTALHTPPLVQVDGYDSLFVRPDAKLDGSKPISGGLPHCFPQFGPGKIQQVSARMELLVRVTRARADMASAQELVAVCRGRMRAALVDVQTGATLNYCVTASTNALMRACAAHSAQLTYTHSRCRPASVVRHVHWRRRAHCTHYHLCQRCMHCIVQHGFARNLEWELESQRPGASPSVTLKLKETKETLDMWPHKFQCLYTVTLSSGVLSTTLKASAAQGSCMIGVCVWVCVFLCCVCVCSNCHWLGVGVTHMIHACQRPVVTPLRVLRTA